MISTIILLIIYNALKFLSSILLLLPDVTVDSNIINASNILVAYLGNFNQYIPLLTIFYCFGIIVAIEILVASFKIIYFFWKKIPSQS